MSARLLLVVAALASSAAGAQTVLQGTFDKSVLRRVVNEHVDGVKRCYEQGLRSDPDLSGRVTVRFVIGRDGSVVSAIAESTDLPPAVSQCVTELARTWRFPKPPNGIVTASYPFTFRSSVAGFGADDEEAPADGKSFDKAVIQRVIRRHLAEVRFCYERELADTPTLEGRVLVKITIAASGNVESAEVAETTARNPRVEGCITRAARGWVFPANESGGKIVVQYPFVLKTEDKAELRAAEAEESFKPTTCPGPLPTLDALKRRLCSLEPKLEAACNAKVVDEVKAAASTAPYRHLGVFAIPVVGGLNHILAVELANGWFGCLASAGADEKERKFSDLSPRDLFPGGAPQILVRSTYAHPRFASYDYRSPLLEVHATAITLCGLGASGQPSCTYELRVGEQWIGQDGAAHQWAVRPTFLPDGQLELRIETGAPDADSLKLVGKHRIVFP